MMNKIKNALELYLLVSILSLFILGLGLYGFREIKKINDNSHELYANRMVSMDNLADIRYYSTIIFSVANQAKTKQITFGEAGRKIKQAQDSILSNWNTYRVSYLSPKEKIIAAETSKLLKKSNATLGKLQAILAQNDIDALNNIEKRELYPAIIPVIDKATLLLNFQIQVGKNIDVLTSRAFNEYTDKIIYMLIAVFAFAIPFTYYLIKKNKGIVEGFDLSNKQLETSEKNYRNSIEFAGEAILIANEAGYLVNLNDCACKLFGYSREEFLQKKITEIVSSQELEKQAADIQYIRTNKKSTVDRIIRRKDGAEIETEITVRLMDDGGLFSIIRDITERKKTERIIKESEEKYRYLFDNNPAYIIIWDLETLRIKEVNKAVYEKYGFSEAEWSSMTVFDYRPVEDHQKIEEFATKILDSNETNSIKKRIWRHLKKNGEEMLMEIASHRIIYDGHQAILSLGRDVTKQVKAETKLIERETQLNLFIEHSPAALAMFDNEMRYIATSHRWISDYNLVHQEIIGKSHYEIFPEISEEWKAIHQRCFQGAIEKREEDLFFRADGSVQWVRWEIRPWHKATGEIGGIIMFTEIITERKKATEMFKNQFDNAPDTILYISKDLKIEAINRDGFRWTKEKLIGMNCVEILPQESQETVKAVIQKCFIAGKPQEIEILMPGNKWARSRMVPLFLKDEVVNIVIFSTDITQQRKAEQKLLESEEKHRVLTENISDAILLLNQNFELEYQSLSAERISGYSFEEVKSKSIFDFFHPDEYEKGRTFFMECRDAPGVPMQNQFRVIDKEGQIIWLEGTALNLLNNKNIRSIIVNYRDITNRKRFEEQQALTASIVNSSDDGIISKDMDGIITSWNVGAEKILGYTAAETVGKHISMLIPLELRNEERSILQRTRQGNSIDHYETQRKKKNGEIIDVSLTISPIRDSLGTIVGASKIMRNITERKKFENDLIHYNAELKKTNSELDRFVYSASHDLRAPLKSILGLVSITKDDVNEDAELCERLTMLENSVKKLDDFIEEILNYSKNTRLELHKEPIDFEKAISDIQKNHKFMDDLKEVDVRVKVSPDGEFISDNGRINVILNNVFSNAIKYQDVTKKTSFVDISVRWNRTKAVILVEDNGIGISNIDKEKVFQMFYRATTVSTGSGLGLYIVKEMLARLGGKIELTSEIGKGTQIIIEIPNLIDSLN